MIISCIQLTNIIYLQFIVKASDVYPETTLNEYLRETLQLTGTKKMCLEGGCGSCVVAVTAIDPVTEREVLFSVNSVRTIPVPTLKKT